MGVWISRREAEGFATRELFFPYKAKSVIKISVAEKSVNKEEHERRNHYKQWGQGFLAEK